MITYYSQKHFKNKHLRSLIVELQYSSTDHREAYEEIKTSVSGAGFHDTKQFRQKATH